MNNILKIIIKFNPLNLINQLRKYIALFYVLKSFCFCSENSTLKPYELLKALSINNGWNYVSTENNIDLSSKYINQMNTKAVKVQKETDIPIDVISEILMDIKNYKNYFNSPASFNFSEVNRRTDLVEGHHFIAVNIPFMKNREYFFRMHPTSHQSESSNTFLHWYLIGENSIARDKIDSFSEDTIYLRIGAGVWNKEDLDNGKNILSYRLMLNPGGTLPESIIDKLSRVSIVNLFKDIIQEAERRVFLGYQNSKN
jgi:hypothetical protein